MWKVITACKPHRLYTHGAISSQAWPCPVLAFVHKAPADTERAVSAPCWQTSKFSNYQNGFLLRLTPSALATNFSNVQFV